MMDYSLMINIAEMIIQFRKEKHLSQTELALKAGISRSFLGRIERMESVPSLNTLRKIENALQHMSNHLISHPVSAEELRLIEKVLLAVTDFIIT